MRVCANDLLFSVDMKNLRHSGVDLPQKLMMKDFEML